MRPAPAIAAGDADIHILAEYLLPLLHQGKGRRLGPDLVHLFLGIELGLVIGGAGKHIRIGSRIRVELVPGGVDAGFAVPQVVRVGDQGRHGQAMVHPVGGKEEGAGIGIAGQIPIPQGHGPDHGIFRNLDGPGIGGASCGGGGAVGGIVDGFPLPGPQAYGDRPVEDAGQGLEHRLAGDARLALAVFPAGGGLGIIEAFIRTIPAIAHVPQEGPGAKLIHQVPRRVEEEYPIPLGAQVEVQMQVIFFLPLRLIKARGVYHQVFPAFQGDPIREHPLGRVARVVGKAVAGKVYRLAALVM